MLALAFLAVSSLLWHDPGQVEAADLSVASGPPKPPYTFVREDMNGTSPKLIVRDAAGLRRRDCCDAGEARAERGNDREAGGSRQIHGQSPATGWPGRESCSWRNSSMGM